MLNCRILTAALLVLAPVAQAGDPLRPPAAMQQVPAATASDPVYASPELSSILYSSQRRIAVINGQRLQEGDTVAGAKLISIKADRVLLRHDGRTQVLKLRTATGFKQRIHAHD